VEGVSERTGDVPLFVEEVTRLLLERGEQGGVQTIPPAAQQSLAARLDPLGAVIGRDFAYMLLHDVPELDEPTLQVSLDRLANADLLFVEGAPPQASYRFKHADPRCRLRQLAQKPQADAAPPGAALFERANWRSLAPGISRMHPLDRHVSHDRARGVLMKRVQYLRYGAPEELRLER
jgi:hypothetical protein